MAVPQIVVNPQDRAPLHVLLTLEMPIIRWSPLTDPLPVRLLPDQTPLILVGASIILPAVRRQLWRYAPLIGFLLGEVDEANMLLPSTDVPEGGRQDDLYRLREVIYVNKLMGRTTWPPALKCGRVTMCAQEPGAIRSAILAATGQARRPRHTHRRWDAPAKMAVR
jgi:hypothetical protein